MGLPPFLRPKQRKQVNKALMSKENVMAKKAQMPWKVEGDGPEMASTTPDKGRKAAGPPQKSSQRSKMGPTRKVDDSVKKMK